MQPKPEAQAPSYEVMAWIIGREEGIQEDICLLAPDAAHTIVKI